MGTASFIGREVEGLNMIVGSYCHYDGYLVGVGKTLYENWNSLVDANKAASHGYFSGLLETPAELGGAKDAHASSDNADYYSSEKEFIDTADFWGCEFAYLYKDGKWYYVELGIGVEEGKVFSFSEIEPKLFLPELKYSLTYFRDALSTAKKGTPRYDDYVEYVDYYSKEVEKIEKLLDSE